jgi:uncharacterized protein
MKGIKRYFKPPKASYFLFGPRGTGKSTWVKNEYPDSLYIDLLMTDIFRTYSATPELLVKYLDANSEKKTVVIDEIQRVPELLSVIHALIEQQRGIQFVMTGSSARKLKRTGVDLLAGRAIKEAMHPFMASELGEFFNLEKALRYGMLPLIWNAVEIEKVLDSYVDLYIMEEVQFEGLVRNVGSFSRFLSIIAFSHAGALNVSTIARDCEVKRSIVENYLEILKDLLLTYLIPVFTNRAKRALASHPKLYLFDSGVFRALRRTGPMDMEQELDGGAIEGLVLQHLKAWCDYSSGKYQISYWRTKAGLEVDFIIYGEGGFWAIEVKNNKKVFSSDLRGLKHFSEDYPECTPLLLYRGKDKLMEDGILCMPCEDFLKQLIPNRPLVAPT